MKSAPDFESLSEYDTKVTTLTFHQQFRQFLPQEKSSTSTIDLLAEDTLTSHFCLIFRRENPLNNIFLRKIDQIITGGLSGRLKQGDYIKKHFSNQADEHNPHPLTMNHLGVCFAAILICLGLSFVVFLLECSTRFFA
jgi:predicted nucleotidyltransferase